MLISNSLQRESQMTTPIHVAMIILDYYPRVGGAQTQLAMLAPLLQAQNIQISVLTRRFPGLAAYGS